jgi:ParB/RepB/Spo0J family partition protein
VSTAPEKRSIIDVEEGETEAEAKARAAAKLVEASPAIVAEKPAEEIPAKLSVPSMPTAPASERAAREAAKRGDAAEVARLTDAPAQTVPMKPQKTSGAPALAVVERIPLDQIDVDPNNPRKTFNQSKLEELARDIKLHGVTQPTIVRPNGKRYMLVVGERRYRASMAAGEKTLPAIVRVMTDAEALEQQLIENDGDLRQPVHPLEEAEAYRKLHEKHGLKTEELAKRLGKSREWVYGRLQLLKLGEEGRQAFRDGKLSTELARLVARVPNPETQQRVLKDILEKHHEFNNETGVYGPRTMSYREALEHIQEHYMVKLSGAAFSLEDATLTDAGSCAACPKRTGNAAGLFADVKGANVCTDPGCFRDKEKAALKRKREQLEAKGADVLSPAEAKRVFQVDYDDKVRIKPNAEFVEAAEKVPGDRKGRTWGDLVDASAKKVAIDPKGKAHQLVPLDQLKKAVKETGAKVELPKAEKTARDVSYDWKREQEREEKARVIREQIAAKVIEAEVAAVEASKETEAAFLRQIALHHSPEVMSARGWKSEKDVQSWIAKADVPRLRGMIAQAIIGSARAHTWNGYAPEIKELATAHKIDIAKLEAELKAALKEQEKAKAVAEEKPAPAAKTAEASTEKPAAKSAPKKKAKAKKGKAA